MNNDLKARIASLLEEQQEMLLSEWAQELQAQGRQQGAISDKDLKQQCKEFLTLFRDAVQGEEGGKGENLRNMLGNLARSRAENGFTPTETATFVFSFKKPLYTVLHKEFSKDSNTLIEVIWGVNQSLDRLGLYTTEVTQSAREEVIRRQQQDMLELSTPVVSLAEGILALPLIGTLDSARTQVVMESLLQTIVTTGSTVAIIDITGVPTVDTLVAQHLLKTVTAARLMGADCIISGIRPQIAQTIVHLGVELGNVITKATLASAFKIALDMQGMKISRVAPVGAMTSKA
ncbi:MAG: hypothetical protein JWM96_990 [Alphaproteobacteria bacterium]|nr:hypothetical protein [Alphaproteobacteria bacterium]